MADKKIHDINFELNKIYTSRVYFDLLKFQEADGHIAMKVNSRISLGKRENNSELQDVCKVSYEFNCRADNRKHNSKEQDDFFRINIDSFFLVTNLPDIKAKELKEKISMDENLKNTIIWPVADWLLHSFSQITMDATGLPVNLDRELIVRNMASD